MLDALRREEPRHLWGQAVVLLIVLAGLSWMGLNAVENMERRGLSLGFGFLFQRAGFAISEHLIAFSPSDTFARALMVGAVNTVWVAFWGCLLTTIVGIVGGMARVSSNPLVARIAELYVEVGRNVPVLLQLLFWYSVIRALGGPGSALELVPGMFVSNRGLQFPTLDYTGGPTGPVLGLVITGVILAAVRIPFQRRFESPAVRGRFRLASVATLCVGVLLGGWLAGGTLSLNVPALRGFNFAGGSNISAEFTALLVGLTFYTGAFVTEIVRGGIQAVHAGQWEAGKSLGLSGYRTFSLIILPQVMRMILPPLTSQYINLTKNSSIAVAIGYPDLINISNTSINQTGQAVQIVVLFMAVYLAISLTISALANGYGLYVKRRGG